MHAGEIVALLGPNGAGKSTLLSIAATLLEPSSGEVRYGNQPAGDRGPALRAQIGLLGHDLYLYPDLSAGENLQFFARLHGLDDSERRVAAALAQAGLEGRRDDPVASFSRGMRQRLALERALLHDPRLVLLDEPFTGLDDQASAALIQRVAGLAAAGRLVLITTHDFEAVEPLASRAVLLQAGRLLPVAAGPGRLRDRYLRVSATASGAPAAGER